MKSNTSQLTGAWTVTDYHSLQNEFLVHPVPVYRNTKAFLLRYRHMLPAARAHLSLRSISRQAARDREARPLLGLGGRGRTVAVMPIILYALAKWRQARSLRIPDSHSPAPTAAPPSDLLLLHDCRYQPSTRNRSPAPTAAPPSDLLLLQNCRWQHPTRSRSPAPTAAPRARQPMPSGGTRANSKRAPTMAPRRSAHAPTRAAPR